MKIAHIVYRLLVPAMVGVGIAGAADEAVISPTRRQEVLSLAKTILAAPTAVEVGKDPFYSEAYLDSLGGGASSQTATPSTSPEATPALQSGPRSPRELLQAIASSPSLKPTAVFMLREGPMLVFGQKRVKAGGTLTITFEGTEYALEIVSIAPPNFTLRLNREEFTRPIK